MEGEGTALARAPYLPPMLPRLSVAALALLASPLGAQVRLDADLTLSTRHVERGELLVAGPSLQPRAWAERAWKGTFLSAGVWALAEAGTARAGRPSLRGPGRARVALWEPWAQAGRRVLSHELTLGVVRHGYAGDSLFRVSGDAYWDVYLQAERSAHVPVVERWWYRARAWRALEASGGAYAEVAMGPQWLLAPLRDLSVALVGGAGVSLTTARPGRARPGITGARDLTHYSLTGVLASSPHCDGRSTRVAVLDALVPRQLDVGAHLGRTAVARTLRRGVEDPVIVTLAARWAPWHCARAR